MGALAAQGRWTVFVCDACGEATGRHKDCDNAHRTATPVVPFDDAAIERAAKALERGWVVPELSYALAFAALQAAGEAT